jgi:hypothetical protein
MSDCKTPDAIYHVGISPRTVSIVVDFPSEMDLTEREAIILENELHDALEMVLADRWSMMVKNRKDE